MLSEILKIKPQLDNSDLKKMERTLSQRFTKIAKGFGKGLSSIIKGGAIAAVATTLIDKLLNPLKEVQEAIERSLNYSDDLVTNARQFGTTSGRLAKLQAFGKSAGLEPEALNTLMSKFQTAVAEAIADPTKKTSVRNFTDNKDTAAAFFEFIQAVQRMEKNQQILVQQEVFGEKQILKMSDFLNSDFADVNKFFKGISSDKITGAADKMGNLKDLSDTMTAVRDLKDIETKGRLINTGTIKAMENSKQIALNKENKRIANFDVINNVNDKMNQISTNIETLATTLFTAVPHVVFVLDKLLIVANKLAEFQADIIKKITNSKVMKYFTGGKDK